MRRLITVALAGTLSVASLPGHAETSLAETISSYQQDAQAAEGRDRQRLDQLLNNRQALEQAVNEAEARLKKAQAEREQLDKRQAEQQKALTELNQARSSQGQDLTPVFDVLRRSINKTRNDVQDSWLTLGNEAVVPDAIDDNAIPSNEQFSTYIDQLSQLIARSAEAVRLQVPVAGHDGSVSVREVTRLGAMSAVGAENLLRPPHGDTPVNVAERTPDDVQSQLRAFAQGDSNRVPFDPSGGNVLDAFAQQPTLGQRIAQGGVVGYVTIALGVIGLLVGLAQLGYLLTVSGRIRRQVGTLTTLHEDNPLGRVLKRFQGIRRYHQPEVLEARLDEMLLAEQPKLERGQSFVKLVAAVAPLMGLLGTVTGMIGTFQSITVFGSGDPKLMAGGISQALVTTVLGLIVAIPVLFTHTAIASRSKKLMTVLEGQASAALANHLDVQESELAEDVLQHSQRRGGRDGRAV
ncbi:MotA/TolQ/ExbB proton channel family protein [Phytohalomonas tamaricis]|uniref:MotA/TolQ/ExbB proton channel family protein n=1 Tax=Phytohalomonas tamaricis TaxID=2081032 RepID=UPI000D0B1E06|nr:MotA/TolQ/ExbB proton channel family protein [Phytohalomonas tamaricis]